MLSFVLDVPLVGQKTTSDARPLQILDSSGKYVTHGYMACWYASACMVSYFYRAGPRQGLPEVWAADKGLKLADIEKLMKVEGLLRLPKPSLGLTPASVFAALVLYGPVWAAGRYLDGQPTAGHAVVITGVQGDDILYNDPWEPQKKRKPATWFDTNLIEIPNALLVKDKMRS